MSPNADREDIRTALGGDAVAVHGWRNRPRGSGTVASAAGGAVAHSASAATYTYRYVIACIGNTPADPVKSLCGVAANGCGPGELLRWIYRAPTDATGATTAPFAQIGEQCLGEDAAAAAAAAPFPGVTEEDFRRLPLPPAAVHIQPDNGYALINIPTNVYAAATPVTVPTTVVGVAVNVRATPETFTWSFGDGATLGPTTETGAPYPDLGLTHTYTQPQRTTITLTTTYTGEYSVAGGPWLAIDGTATVTSPAVPLTVLSAHAALVEDPLTD